MYPLVETYLYHVGKLLPQSQRKDIVDELRANIFDQLDAMQAPIDEKTVEMVLLSLGSPETVAKAYTQDTRCVIGPELVDIYWTVLKFVLVGVTIAYAVIAILMMATMDYTVNNITQNIIKFIAQTWQTGLSVYAMITLIFTAIYQGIKSEALDKNDIPNHSEQAWNTKKLISLKTPPPEADKLKKTDCISSIIGIVVGFLIFNGIAYGFNGNLGIGWISEQGLETVTFKALNDALIRTWMPLINVLFFSNLMLNIYLLIQDKWSNKTRLLTIALELIGFAVFLVIWMNPSFLDLTQVSATLAAKTAESFELSMKITRLIVAAVVSVITGFTVFGHAIKIKR